MNFILSEMTFLRYFIPLIIAGNKMGIKSTIYYYPSNKYNCPIKNFTHLESLSKNYKFNLKRKDCKKLTGTTFLIEGVGANEVEADKKISLTYMSDFQISYQNYINKVDHVIFPSENFCKAFGIENKKNLYLGSPKYDVVIDKSKVNKKYGLNDSKKVLIIYPRNRDVNKVDLPMIYEVLKDNGYEIVVKSRGKDPAMKHLRGDVYFEDYSWFPHTSMELMTVCDMIINTDSTAIKEATMLEKPVINLNIKPFKQIFSWLYEYDHVVNLNNKVNKNEFNIVIKEIESKNFNSSFKKAKEEWLFEGNVSKNILETFYKLG